MIKLIERHSIERGAKIAKCFINTDFSILGIYTLHSLTYVDHDCQEHQGPVNDFIYSRLIHYDKYFIVEEEY